MVEVLGWLTHVVPGTTQHRQARFRAGQARLFPIELRAERRQLLARDAAKCRTFRRLMVVRVDASDAR
jgi:hypothetical protein